MYCAQRWSLVILIVTCVSAWNSMQTFRSARSGEGLPKYRLFLNGWYLVWLFKAAQRENKHQRRDWNLSNRHFAQMQHSVSASCFTRGLNGKDFDPTVITRTPGEENAGLSFVVVLYKRVKQWFVPFGQSNVATYLRQDALSARIMREI